MKTKEQSKQLLKMTTEKHTTIVTKKHGCDSINPTRKAVFAHNPQLDRTGSDLQIKKLQCPDVQN